MNVVVWILVGVVAVLAGTICALIIMVRRLATELSSVAGGLADLSRQTLPLLADTRSALRKADGANRKTDALLDVATSLTGTADSASRLAYKVVSNPLVKVLAFFTGTRRAAKRLADVTAPGGRTAKRIERGHALTTTATRESKRGRGNSTDAH